MNITKRAASKIIFRTGNLAPCQMAKSEAMWTSQLLKTCPLMFLPLTKVLAGYSGLSITIVLDIYAGIKLCDLDKFGDI